MTFQLSIRPKRLRKSAVIRDLLQETCLRPEHIIAPLFISEILSEKKAIQTMPGQFQLPLSAVAAEVDELYGLGIKAVLLFGIPAQKDATGSASLQDDGVIQQAIKIIRKQVPDMLVITDVCFCEYTSHGHCGIYDNEHIDNDQTLKYLGMQAVSHARAGAQWVAPSSMTDGMVQAIRQALDEAGFIDTAILSYSVKYASGFYGPFREAAEGAPKSGDRKAYQMNYANSREALREASLDIAEGADLIMVKPAGNYLDIIAKIKHHFPEIPLCAYQVSGEFAMLKQGAAAGLFNEQDAMMESLVAIRRAGADLIISYFAKDLARLQKTILVSR